MKKRLALAAAFAFSIIPFTSFADNLEPDENQIKKGGELVSTNLEDYDFIYATPKDTNLISFSPLGYNADLSGGDLSGVRLGGAKMSSVNFEDANLSGAFLKRADLSNSNLTKANLSGANLQAANINHANLKEADLSNAKLVNASIVQADLTGADLSGADLSGADLYNADLRETTFRGITAVRLKRCPEFLPEGLVCNNKSLIEEEGGEPPLTLNESYLIEPGADLSGADLSDADLNGADLTEANLFNANLTGANLNDADLSNANLSNANLKDADLSGADLSGAELRLANLMGANLTDVIAEDLRSCPIFLPVGWVCEDDSLIEEEPLSLPLEVLLPDEETAELEDIDFDSITIESLPYRVDCPTRIKNLLITNKKGNFIVRVNKSENVYEGLDFDEAVDVFAETYEDKCVE